jgi:hypothetical protein
LPQVVFLHLFIRRNESGVVLPVFYLFNSWQIAILAMEGKSVLPMSIGPFLGKGGSIS